MTLTELRYVIAIAREKHFGHAAEACCVSQPTLSVAIRKLEDELGVILFERSRSEVASTMIGQQIIAQAQRVLEEVELIRRLATQGQDQLAGLLRVGVIYTAGPYLMPHLIPILRQRAPKMPLQIEEDYTHYLSERLNQGKLDAIIVSLPYDFPGMNCEPLYEEPFVVLLPKNHRLESETQITSEMLAQEKILLLGQNHCYRQQLLNVFPESVSTAPHVHLTVDNNSLEPIRLMVASGAGVTLMPKTAVHHINNSHLLSVRPYAHDKARRTIGLAWRRSFARPAAIKVLQESIAECRLGEDVLMLTQL